MNDKSALEQIGNKTIKQKFWILIKSWAEKKLRTTTEAKEEQRELPYEPLSPIDTVDDDAPYYDALDWALKNPDVRNIAVSGPYGSGKSSVLRTFEKKYTGYEYLNISLAAFSEEQKKPGKKDSEDGLSPSKQKEANNESSRLIELSILQQMFYKVSDSQIPESRFKRIKVISGKATRIYTTMSMLGLIALLCIIWPKFLSQFSWWKNMDGKHGDLIIYGALIILLPILAFLFVNLFKRLNNYQFNKLNLTSGEIEINPKSETSILNKYLDEILYFFEQTAYDVVLIEDLDRFNDPEIFTKLRELNILINNAKPIAAKKMVKFVYAIKDDMFLDKTRAKFFDFIIPIIPIINSSNSIDIILNTESKKAVISDMPENFVADVMLYISDMRVLKNIFNEYFLYKESLKKIKPKPEKLFAIVTYKNIYPNDFAKLHEGKGMLHKAFSSKDKILERLIAEIQEKLTILEQQKAQLLTQSDLKIAEINKLYLFNLRTLIPTAMALDIDGERLEWGSLAEQVNFDKLIGQSAYTYYYFSPSYRAEQSETGVIGFAEVESASDEKLKYADRVELTKKSGSTLIKKIDDQIMQLKKQISELDQQPLKTILSSSNNSFTILEDGLDKEKLLVYLLKHGYIDEMYPTFISYFYEGSLMQKDMEYLMSIKDQHALQFDFRLEKTPELCKRISIIEFGRCEIFNHQMIDYLILNRTTEAKKLEAFLLQFVQPSEKALEFFDGYLTSGKMAPKFLALIAKKWDTMIPDLFSNESLEEDKKTAYMVLMLKHIELEDLVRLNIKNKLTHRIDRTPNFISLFDKTLYGKLQPILIKLNVRFDTLEHQVAEQNELLDFIYEQSLYEINIETMQWWFIYKGKANEAILKDLLTSNYTTVQNSGLSKLKQYIENGIGTYLEEVFFAIETNTKESEKTIIALLANENVSNEDKSQIIAGHEFEITDISAINKNLWSEIFEHGKVQANWENVINYFDEIKAFDEHLTILLNDVTFYTVLSKRPIYQAKLPLENKQNAARELVKYDQLSLEAFSALTVDYYNYTSVGSFTVIPMERMQLLIDRDHVKWSETSFNAIKKAYGDLHLHFLMANLKAVFKDLEKIAPDSGDTVFLLRSKRVMNGQKLQLANLVTAEMIEENNELADILAGLLATNLFRALTYPVLENIFTYSGLNKEKSIIFEMQLFRLTNEQIGQLMLLMGRPYKDIAVRPKSINIEANDISRSIISRLKEKKFISKFKEEKGLLKITNKL